MANAVNPYGDGKAAKRAVAAIGALLGLGERAESFSPNTAVEEEHIPRFDEVIADES